MSSVVGAWAALRMIELENNEPNRRRGEVEQIIRQFLNSHLKEFEEAAFHINFVPSRGSSCVYDVKVKTSRENFYITFVYSYSSWWRMPWNNGCQGAFIIQSENNLFGDVRWKRLKNQYFTKFDVVVLEDAEYSKVKNTTVPPLLPKKIKQTVQRYVGKPYTYLIEFESEEDGKVHLTVQFPDNPVGLKTDNFPQFMLGTTIVKSVNEQAVELPTEPVEYIQLRKSLWVLLERYEREIPQDQKFANRSGEYDPAHIIYRLVSGTLPELVEVK